MLSQSPCCFCFRLDDDDDEGEITPQEKRLWDEGEDDDDMDRADLHRKRTRTDPAADMGLGK